MTLYLLLYAKRNTVKPYDRPQLCNKNIYVYAETVILGEIQVTLRQCKFNIVPNLLRLTKEKI